jgi:hypothetical protein
MLPVTVLNKKIPIVVKIAPPKSTPVCPKAFTTGPAKNLPTGHYSCGQGQGSTCQMLRFELNTIRWPTADGPNSEIAVKCHCNEQEDKYWT